MRTMFSGCVGRLRSYRIQLREHGILRSEQSAFVIGPRAIRLSRISRLAELTPTVDFLPYWVCHAQTTTRHCISHGIAVPAPGFNWSCRCVFGSRYIGQKHLFPRDAVDHQRKFRAKHRRCHDWERNQILPIQRSHRYVDCHRG